MRFRAEFVFRALIVVLTLGTALLSERSAQAQGTSGTVADPLSLRATSDLLTRYTKLRPEQRIAIEEAHDRYLEAFERLREGEIRDFLNLTRELEGGNAGVLPSVEQMDRLFKEWEAVNRRVAALDADLFERIRGSLDDDQADAIERARLIRDRTRILASNGMTMRGGQFGIDEVFWRLEPSPEERIAVDEVLRGLESSMPRLSEDLAEASVGMIREMVRVMVDSGFEGLTEADMADPAVMQDVMMAMQTAQRAAMAPMMKARTAIEDRDIAAARSLRSRLAPDRWHRLKRMWVSTAFPLGGLGRTGGNATDVPRHAEAVRAALAGDPAGRSELESRLKAWYAADDRITDELIEIGRRREAAQFEDPMSMAGDPFGPELSEGIEERSEIARAAIRGILELVSDPAARAKIERDVARGRSMIVQEGAETPMVAETEDGLMVVEGVSSPAGSARGTGDLPAPMSTGDLALVKWLLELGPDRAAVVDVLYADYLESWAGNVSPRIEEVDGVPRFGEDGRRRSEAVEDRGRRLNAALDAILEVDREFFAAVDVAVGEESRSGGLAAAVVQRGFDRIASISASPAEDIFGLPVIEPSSPYPLIEELDLGAEQEAEALAARFARREDRARAIEGGERRRLESDLALELASTEFEATTASMRGEARDEVMAATAAASQRYFERSIESSARRLRNAERRRAIVQSVVEEALLPVLPSLAGLEVRVAMFDEGWSGVRDPASGLAIARRVLRLRDLTPDQTVVVESLLLDHLEREAGLIDSMSAEIDRLGEIGGDSVAEMMRSSEISEKFRFRRGEMQERLIQRLLAVLDSTQIARIPELARRTD
ncbi:MAG: hypothetical protein VX672_01490 [Planctomycetota bacterium]|nr:hypothetical protein [Planctomycetota bacterium]